MALTKLRKANKKWKHEQRRRAKKHQEKLGIIREKQKKAQNRRLQARYVSELKEELGIE